MQGVRIHTWMVHDLFAIAIESIFSNQSGFSYAGSLQERTSLQYENETPSSGKQVKDILITDTLACLQDCDSTFSHMKQEWHSLRVLYLLPSDADVQSVVGALRSRADGFLFQSAAREMIIRSVHTIAEGKSFLQPDITPMVLAELCKNRVPAYEIDSSVELTEREHMLLQLSADGLSNQRISEMLFVQEKTVRNMWSRLFQKLGVNDRTQAVLWAIRSGRAQLH